MRYNPFIFLAFFFGCNAEGKELPQPMDASGKIVLTKEYTSDSLNADEAVYYFNFKGLKKEDHNASVRYSLNDSEFSGKLNGSKLRIKTSPDTYKFAIYINYTYYEVFTDSLTIAPKTVQVYKVKLSKRPKPKRPNNERVVYKPVIYLYPENEQMVNVTIDVHGTNPFYYPIYDNSWEVLAHPNGDLELNGETYNYLFWEADDEDHLEEIEVNEGFVVSGHEAVSFLEEKLKLVGFTSQERADFITFWGPKIAANDHSLVRFEWNETCDKFADLNIVPQPDHIYRFYIFMSALDNDFSIQPQLLPTFNREGFVVLEWGGQLSNYQPNTSL